jgi:hypothetical protein
MFFLDVSLDSTVLLDNVADLGQDLFLDPDSDIEITLNGVDLYSPTAVWTADSISLCAMPVCVKK